ncbi:MAG: L,D-transpeptidase [Methyloprofundus sp.]|nr:L,D-transpeptidase [Methyloprofundus sp.]MDT8425177.1 L,D-transpeptidase [Methyloprofundus sp.]
MDCYAQDAIWLLVNTQKRMIQVKRGNHTLQTFEKISLGRKGAAYKQKSGDNITPLGSYKIAYINDKSHFRKFFGLNYPSIHDAGLAFQADRISYSDYQLIIQAHRMNKIPPQDTHLGGQLGIHGVGRGDKRIQGIFDWTQGCVAVSNQQIDQLASWVFLGMRVEIK